VLVDHRYLLTGDAMYTIRHLAVDQVRAIQPGDEARYVDSVRRIQWLRREFPELVILAAHDHTDYGERLIAGLADGELSDADLSWAMSYERATFDELANLNPARLPRFVPAEDGGPVGHAA
jgi:N-acyl homoserine lactone hydrolase